MTKYRVMIDDNFDYMNEDERHEHSTYEHASQALAACRRIVDQDLLGAYKQGMTAGELDDAYTSFGRDPFVVAVEGGDRIDFSAWGYAKERCPLLTGR